MSALDTQVGGDHYKNLKIQPMEYSMANKLDACQHTAIKYITRFRDKGGIADLEKAKHCIDMLIEFEREGWAEVEPVKPCAPSHIVTDEFGKDWEVAAGQFDKRTIVGIRAMPRTPWCSVKGCGHGRFADSDYCTEHQHDGH